MNSLLIIIAILLTHGQSIDYSECRQEKLFLDGFANKIYIKNKEMSGPIHGEFRIRSENIYRYFDALSQKNVVVIFSDFTLCDSCFYHLDRYLIVPNEQAKGKIVVYSDECASIIVNPLLFDKEIDIRVEHTYTSKEDLTEFEQNLRELTKSRFGW